MQPAADVCEAETQQHRAQGVSVGAVLNKTPLGQQAFKERSAQLAGKLRSAFLLFDGQRTVPEVLNLTQSLGVTAQDIETLQQAGMLQAVTACPHPEATRSARTPQERYRDAYPLAVSLTGKLGLPGFRLNLSVEAATSYEALAAVAPKIKEAVGPAAFTPLAQALFD